MTGDNTVTIAKLGIDFLQRPIDFDDNTLIHYAIYFETYQVINAICGIAHNKFHGLDKVLTQKNKYGQTPWTFAQIANDDSIKLLIKSQLDIVETIKTKTQLFPAIKAATIRLFALLTNIDVGITLICTFVAYIVFNFYVQ